jgi:Putative bacterial sensory transduction regulator
MKHIALGFMLAAFFLVPPAAANDLPPGGMTAQEVADWLRSQGYPAVVKPDPTTPGDQIVSSSIDNINFDMYMYGCAQGRCDSLQYAAGWSPKPNITTDKINGWDRDKRYIRAYIADDGGIWGEYDIDITPGGTYEALTHSLERWRSQLNAFEKFVNQ